MCPDNETIIREKKKEKSSDCQFCTAKTAHFTGFFTIFGCGILQTRHVMIANATRYVCQHGMLCLSTPRAASLKVSFRVQFFPFSSYFQK